MPAIPLTAQQLEDASRLKQRYEEWKARRKAAKEPASQEVATEMLGFNQSAVSQYLNGKIPLNVDAATKFATVFGCAVRDFSPSLADQVVKYTQAAEEGVISHPLVGRSGKVVVLVEGEKEAIAIKLVSLRLEAGYPNFEADQEFEDNGTISIPRREIEANDWVPQCLLAIKVRGDSMKPAFNDKDTVVINIADTKPISGEVYAINFDGKPVIKQLVHEGREWWMYSFNRDAEYGRRLFRSPESVVVGKVVYQPARRIAGRVG